MLKATPAGPPGIEDTQRIDGWDASELRGGDFIVTTVLAALLSLAAPLYPAWLAATTNLSEGLRHD